MKMKLKITLESDTCLASGDTLAGVVDTEIAADGYGIPMLPGRRLKGLFREAAKELLEFGMTDEETIADVFGAAGGNGAKAVFDTLYPVGRDELVKFLKEAESATLWAPYQKREKVIEYFTVNRAQTAIDEDGIALENSLRILRAVKKGTVFEGEIHFLTPASEEELTLLEQCAAMVRHIGMNRTRGMGNVLCEVTAQTEEAERQQKTEEKSQEQDGVLRVHIHLEQPCAMEQNFIPGNVLRGIYAAAFAREEAGTEEELHKNETFRQLFLGNQVKFGYCWPYYEEKVYYPTPCTFLKESKTALDEVDEVYDLAACEADEVEEFLEGKERLGAEFIRLDGEGWEINAAEIIGVSRKEIYHHRRPEDRSIGHASKSSSEKASAADGQLYSMDAVCEEQEFLGEIYGEDDLLHLLQELLPEGSICWLGNSRSAQYGKARISYSEEVTEEKYKDDYAKNTVITLMSPMAVQDEMGNSSTALEDVCHTLFPEGDTEGNEVRGYCKEGWYGSYNAKWGMPVSKRNVLLPGSVIVIYGLKLYEESVEEMNRTFYGLYQNEGFGRICVNWHGGSEEFYCSKRKPEKPSDGKMPEHPEDYQGLIKEFGDYCLRDMLVKHLSGESEGAIMGRLRRHLEEASSASMLGNVQQMCMTSNSFKEFSEQLGNASEREVNKKTNWYSLFFNCLNSEENIIIEKDGNNFYDRGRELLAEKNYKDKWRERLKQMLDNECYELFRELFLQLIYRVHLNSENGRNKE